MHQLLTSAPHMSWWHMVQQTSCWHLICDSCSLTWCHCLLNSWMCMHLIHHRSLTSWVLWMNLYNDYCHSHHHREVLLLLCLDLLLKVQVLWLYPFSATAVPLGQHAAESKPTARYGNLVVDPSLVVSHCMHSPFIYWWSWQGMSYDLVPLIRGKGWVQPLNALYKALEWGWEGSLIMEPSAGRCSFLPTLNHCDMACPFVWWYL